MEKVVTVLYIGAAWFYVYSGMNVAGLGKSLRTTNLVCGYSIVVDHHGRRPRPRRVTIVLFRRVQTPTSRAYGMS